MIDVIEHVIEVGKSVKNGRTTQDIAIKLAEESGEVMGEISIITGLSDYKKTEALNLCDELVDTFINVVDLGVSVYGDDFQKLFEERLKVKCDKWIEKYNKQKAN